MKMQEIRSLSTEEMTKKCFDLREEISTLSFQHRIRTLEDTSKIRQFRKDIARILTIQNETKTQ